MANMPLKILFVTATSMEAEVLGRVKAIQIIPGGYLYGNITISVLVAGVGSVSTAWEMQKWIYANGRPDVALNAGIAGSYREEIKIGDVVMPLSDCFADSGVEDGDRFLTLSEAGLADADQSPFIDGVIRADPRYRELMNGILKPVKAITVNTATGSEATRDRLIKKYDPDIETMEGATFFYICSREKIPFLALRAISNIVEIRNRDKWDIKLALSALEEKIDEVFLTL
jgi:futalosine hydrolase